MRRSLRKAVCCFGAVLVLFAADVSPVHAEEEFECGAWKDDSRVEECRTPICDGVHLTSYLTVKRHKDCTYLATGYQFTIPDTYVKDNGCCKNKG